MTVKSAFVVGVFAVLAGSDATCGIAAEAMSIDLAAADAVGQWRFLENTATIQGGELVLDGRQEMSARFSCRASGAT